MTAMTNKEMAEVINLFQVGDRARIVFADKPIHKGRIYQILMMFLPGGTLSIDELAMYNLKAVADSGHWYNFRSYALTILEGFESEWFERCTIGFDLLESIEKL